MAKLISKTNPLRNALIQGIAPPMKNILMISVLGVLTSVNSFASVSIDCGQLSADRQSVVAHQLQYSFSSEDDNFSGQVGGKWSMWALGKDLGKSAQYTSQMRRRDKSTYFVVTKVDAMTASGPVGTQYTVEYLYTDNPVLTISTVGGFVGSHVIQQVNCVGSYD